jgi:nucleoside-diphosphate-sugar epimerase
MRVLVAGASGAIGTRLIPLLVSAGHRVTGLIRSPSKADSLRRVGAAPVVVAALDPQALREAVLGAQPEVVAHEMTALANASDLRHFDRAFAQTNRLRTEGLDHLLGAAREAVRERSSCRAIADGRSPVSAGRSRPKTIRWIRRRLGNSSVRFRLPLYC